MEFGTEASISVIEPDPGWGSRPSARRLTELLRLNAATAAEKSLYKNDAERLRAERMKRPIDTRTAFGYFGLMIGSMPPLAVALKILSATSPDSPAIALFFVAAGIITGLVGLGLGQRYVPGRLRSIDNFALPNRVALWSVMGLAWGSISGAAGAAVFFLVGSFFGAIFGGVIGAVIVPVMAALHSSVRAGDFIDARHYLPIAFGIILSICAFILGL